MIDSARTLSRHRRRLAYHTRPSGIHGGLRILLVSSSIHSSSHTSRRLSHPPRSSIHSSSHTPRRLSQPPLVHSFIFTHATAAFAYPVRPFIHLQTPPRHTQSNHCVLLAVRSPGIIKGPPRPEPAYFSFLLLIILFPSASFAHHPPPFLSSIYK